MEKSNKIIENHSKEENKNDYETTKNQNVKKGKLSIKEEADVDTSQFTIEERLVSSVWMHERKREHMSIAKIRRDFRQRFDKEPPTKNTLYLWEKKLFSTGNVMDAKRTGRPCSRKDHIEAVEKSLEISPDISSRARATELGISRNTIIRIMQEDLGMTFVDGKAKIAKNTNGCWLKKSSASMAKIVKTDTHSLKRQELAHKTTKSKLQKVIAPNNESVKTENMKSNPVYEHELSVLKPDYSFISYNVPIESNVCDKVSKSNNTLQNTLTLNSSQRHIGSVNDDQKNAFPLSHHNVSLDDTHVNSLNNIDRRHSLTLNEAQIKIETLNDPMIDLSYENHRRQSVTLNDTQSNTQKRFTFNINDTENLNSMCLKDTKPYSRSLNDTQILPENFNLTQTQGLGSTRGNLFALNDNQQNTLTVKQKQFEPINNENHSEAINDSGGYRVSMNDNNQQNLSSMDGISNVNQIVSDSILQDQCYINVKPLSNLQNINLIGTVNTPIQIHQHSSYQS